MDLALHADHEGEKDSMQIDNRLDVLLATHLLVEEIVVLRLELLIQSRLV